MIDYEIIDSTDDGFFKIKFTEERFNDIIFSLGEVKFAEDDENYPVLKYDYTIHEQGKPFEVKSFEQRLGDFLLERLEEGLKNNEITYKGGIDADRNENLVESSD